MACPDDDDLSNFLAGRISSEMAVAIASHVASCRSCEALVEVLGSGSAATLAAPDTRPDDSSDARAGDSVGGYVLQQRVGAGGMGVVWEAYDPDLDRPVALKVMRGAAAHLRARFEQEVRITARLQHPSIVNVFEAGSWRGEPYYVMKLVRGESLDKRLAGCARLDDRLALLPAVITVVDAIAYAHGARVIHRDLKPDNVVLGEFGEAVVIDWGLAKPLDDHDATRPGFAAGSHDGATAAGAVIGTPAYMPPEQARGEPVDAHADVYALGAILYFLLAGHRPYAEAAGDHVVSSVLAGPPAPLPASVPRDLAAIVGKAMARDPAERYASARELADDLKRFQTGQLVASHRYSAAQLIARWLRRHRAAVAVGGVALVVLAVTSVAGIRRILDEKQRATEQQERAEQQRGEAEKLLTFMLVDLREQLAPLGKVAVLERIAQQAEAYFESPRAAEGDPHVRFEALVALSDVRTKKGHSDESLSLLRRAQELARAGVVSAPRDVRWRSAIVETDAKIGAILVDRGDLPGGIAAYRDGLAIAQQIAAEARSDAHDRDVSQQHSLVGSGLALQGDIAGALAEYRETLAIDEDLVKRAPADGARRRELALVHTKLADMLSVRGELATSIAEQRAAVEIMQKLVADDPSATAHARDLGVFRGRLGGLLDLAGQHADAVAEDRGALAILRHAAEREPEDEQIRGYLASSELYLAGDIDHDAPAEALALAREALAIRTRQVASDPTNLEWQQHLLAAEGQVATSLRLTDHPGEALDHARASLALNQHLVEQNPTNTELKGLLVGSYSMLGELLAHLAKYDEALAMQRAGLKVADELVAADPQRADWQRDLADRHASIADVLALTDRAAAAPEYREALAIVERLAAAQPNNAEWPPMIAELRSHLK